METITTNTKTLELNGEEIHVHFTSAFPYFWVRNDNNGTVLMSLSPNIEEGKDGVIEVPAGSSAGTMHGFSNTGNDLYLLGSGKVQVMGTYTPENPFRKDRKGGGENANVSDFVKKFSDYNILSDVNTHSETCTKTQDAENVTYTLLGGFSVGAWRLVTVDFKLKRGKMYKLVVDKFDGYGRLAISTHGGQNPQGSYYANQNSNTAGNFKDDTNLISYNNTNTKYFYPLYTGSASDTISCTIWACTDINRDGPNGTNAHSFEIGLYEEI